MSTVHPPSKTPRLRLLLVDDDAALRGMLAEVMELNHFQVTVASSVPEALKQISSHSFDVLLSDLHMPGAGDGLTVISAMRHANPGAVTFLLSAFPEMVAATRAIQTQADEIITKPVELIKLVAAIQQRLASGPTRPRAIESVAAILERDSDAIVQDWCRLAAQDDELSSHPLPLKLRANHLFHFLISVVERLQTSPDVGTCAHLSDAAASYGALRCEQGYTSAMMVEESRFLQVCIFHCLENNFTSIDFSLLLRTVMTIADEIDAQLAQALRSYIVTASPVESIAA